MCRFERGVGRLPDVNDEELADRYWRWKTLRLGRQERLQAERDAGIYNQVQARLANPHAGLALIDALQRHPDADPVAVDCGPWRTCSRSRLTRWPTTWPNRCLQDDRWRRATRSVTLDPPVPSMLAHDSPGWGAVVSLVNRESKACGRVPSMTLGDRQHARVPSRDARSCPVASRPGPGTSGLSPGGIRR